MKRNHTPKSISKKSMKVLHIRYTLGFLFAVFVLGGVAVFNALAALILFLIFGIIYLFFILFYRKLYYKKFKYSLHNGRLYLQKGVFILKKSITSTKKVQLIEILTSPVQKRLGLSTIAFTFAGGKIKIPNIDADECSKLADEVRDGGLYDI